MRKLFFVLFAAVLLSNGNAYAQKERAVWSKEKANAWYAKKGWLRGSNFIPSTAINSWKCGRQPLSTQKPLIANSVMRNLLALMRCAFFCTM